MTLLHTSGYRPDEAHRWPVDASSASASPEERGVGVLPAALRRFATATCSVAALVRDTVHVTVDVLRGRYDR
jgi:hypothetical protein